MRLDRTSFGKRLGGYAEAISLPLYPLLTDEQQDHVVEQLRRLTE